MELKVYMLPGEVLFHNKPSSSDSRDINVYLNTSSSSSQILLNSCQDIGISIASDGKSRLFSWLSLSDPFMPMHNVLIYTYADDFT